ncbi:hypothetical protein ACKFKG_25510 [Phormidesmis sp. 146-35]
MSYVASAQMDLETLQALLEKYDRASSYYFLRWTHKVSGIQTHLKGFPSPEGQLFNSQLELRWKQVQQSYRVLMLSSEPLNEAGFQPLSGEWEHEDHPVLMHDRTNLTGDRKNPQYPNGFTYEKGIEVCRIQQRCFRNVNTLAVQFIALTVQAS